MNTPKMHIIASLSNYFSDIRVMKQKEEVSTGESDIKMIRTGDLPLWQNTCLACVESQV